MSPIRVSELIALDVDDLLMECTSYAIALANEKYQFDPPMTIYEKDRWGKLMENYFAANRIDLGVMIVDARHAPTNNDITMARWFLDSGCPFVVVANKLDKVKKSQILGNLDVIRRDLELPDECPVIPFSAEKGDGRDDLVKLILRAAGE